MLIQSMKMSHLKGMLGEILVLIQVRKFELKSFGSCLKPLLEMLLTTWISESM